jgi:acetoin utilization protein AcuB
LINKELISTSVPLLSLNDKVYQALQLMNDHHVTQLPVVHDDKYAGMINEDDLFNEDEEITLLQIQQKFSQVSVLPTAYFYDAIQLANDYGLTVVPVTEKDKTWVGAISTTELLKFLSHSTGVAEPGGIIVLEMEKRNFSFSEIIKLVETNDAQITQLNTSFDNNLGVFYVTLKINKFEISDIVATFQRYEYQVKYYFGEELYENELRNNFDHLMNYLNI